MTLLRRFCYVLYLVLAGYRPTGRTYPVQTVTRQRDTNSDNNGGGDHARSHEEGAT